MIIGLLQLERTQPEEGRLKEVLQKSTQLSQKERERRNRNQEEIPKLYGPINNKLKNLIREGEINFWRILKLIRATCKSTQEEELLFKIKRLQEKIRPNFKEKTLKE